MNFTIMNITINIKDVWP